MLRGRPNKKSVRVLALVLAVFFSITCAFAVQAAEPPTVVNTDPVNGATDVSIRQVISVMFSDYVNEGPAFGSITLKDSSGNAVEIDDTNGLSVSYDELTITSKDNLQYATTYTVFIPADAVQSDYGDTMASDYQFSFTTLNSDGTSPIPVQLTVDPQDVSLEVGQTLQLGITTEPTDATVTCTSGNAAVASVTNDGLITPVGEGTTSITVTANQDGYASGTKIINVTVTEFIEQLALTVPAVEAFPGDTVQVPVNLTSFGEVVGLQFDLNFDSSLLTCLGVDGGDLASGFNVVANPASGKVSVMVVSNPLAAVPTGSGSIVDISFRVADSAQPGTSCVLALNNVELSDNQAQPLVPFTKDGSFLVQTPPAKVQISVSPSSIAFTEGQTRQINVTTDPADAAVTYKSSNTGVTTVSSTGLVTAVKKGNAVITVTGAKDSYINGTATVSVSVNATSIGGGGGGGGSTGPDSSKKIDADKGGTLKHDDGVIVVVPAGVLPADATFSIDGLSSSVVPSGLRVKLASGVYEIETDGERDFGDNNITIKIPYDPNDIAEGEQPVVHYYDEDLEQWIALNTTLEYDEDSKTYYAVVQVNHLTKFAVFSTPAKTIKLTIGQVEASVDGKPYTLDCEPYIDTEAGRTLVPLRFVSEALGADVEWLAETRQITIEDTKMITLTLGSTDVTIDDENATIDCAPVLQTSGRTFVPLRFVSETLGAGVDYDDSTKVITITRL
ncbi:MAG TPA: hypothetical protein DEF34_10630 [Desulfotomaculum sp.]|nr:hypothetical protein [Desulfotomaculum sp.]